jgi:DNA-binding transcriptional ArsR family regulator
MVSRSRYHRHMTMNVSSIPAAADLRRAAALFHGLADRNRLAIVAHLARGERRVVDLTKELGLAQGTVSGHLACLRGCGLVVGRPEGRQMFYSLAHPELMKLLSAAEQLLSLTGDAVELCPNYGTSTHPQTEPQSDIESDADPGTAQLKEMAQ